MDVRVEREQRGAVRRITLCRPAKRNALTREMFDFLIASFAEAPSEAERVTVLEGADPVFCAGVDLGQRAENDRRPGHSPLERLCEALRCYPLPVVGVVQGAALGGGFMTAMHCDFVIAAEDAKLGNTAVQLGLVPPWTLTRRLLARTGSTLARELLLLGDPIRASRLAAAGVITAAVPPGQLRASADRVIARLAANAPFSLRAVEATLWFDAYVEKEHAIVDEMIERAQVSDDAEEGALARRQKRAPSYRGT